jgi:hypothetical protein
MQILRAIVAQNRMGQILRALRTERIVLVCGGLASMFKPVVCTSFLYPGCCQDLAGYGTTKEDILNLATTFQEACWGEVCACCINYADALLWLAAVNGAKWCLQFHFCLQVWIDHDTFVECLEAELAIPDTSLADQLFRVFEVKTQLHEPIATGNGHEQLAAGSHSKRSIGKNCIRTCLPGGRPGQHAGRSAGDAAAAWYFCGGEAWRNIQRL